MTQMMEIGVGLLERIAHDRSDVNGHNISINAIDELREILRSRDPEAAAKDPSRGLHYSHRPIVRTAAAMLGLRKPVAPDVELVIAGLQRLLDGVYGAPMEPLPGGAEESTSASEHLPGHEHDSVFLGEPLVLLASMAGTLKRAIDLIQNYRADMTSGGQQQRSPAEPAMAELCVKNLRQHLVTAMRAHRFIEKTSSGKHLLNGLSRDGVTVARDFAGNVHIDVNGFQFVQVRYQYPYTDNASTQNLAAKIVDLLAPCQGDNSDGSADECDWGVFASYLIDKCEGQVIAEERLQDWVGAMSRDPHYGPLFRRESKKASAGDVSRSCVDA